MGPGVLSRWLFAQVSGLSAPSVDITKVDDTELCDQLDRSKVQRPLKRPAQPWWRHQTDLVQAALTFYVEGRLEMLLKQLKEGLGVLGLLMA
ncbi:hypothetical protein PHYPO_G00063250 [Pangasianodon hypophthalmus]|uniref:Uncharacterized protein n=1 Tax=Pangasianodon hypophthalmus TaxID=310915 RepID=A0A5N5M2D0_PANHP|nr:hypothetical protein PHYPO_G00063250 [Pangasianodon hypophthalmus]